MSARILSARDLQTVINAMRVAAEVYLTDALANRNTQGPERITAQFLSQQAEALRLADALEAAETAIPTDAHLPAFLRRQAE